GSGAAAPGGIPVPRLRRACVARPVGRRHEGGLERGQAEQRADLERLPHGKGEVALRPADAEVAAVPLPRLIVSWKLQTISPFFRRSHDREALHSPLHAGRLQEGAAWPNSTSRTCIPVRRWRTCRRTKWFSTCAPPARRSRRRSSAAPNCPA